MHVLFVNIKDKPITLSALNLTGGSGTISSMLYVAKGLSENGCHVSILYKDIAALNEDGISYFALNGADIKSAIREINPDILVVVGHSGYILFDERLTNKKIIYWAHNWLDIKKYKTSFMNGYIDKFVFVSDYHRVKSLLGFRFSPRIYQNSITILNPLDLSKIIQKESYKIYPPLKIAFVGYPSLHKGFLEVCKIVHQLVERENRIVLNVYGDSNLYDDSNNDLFSDKLIKNLILRGNIIIKGTLGRNSLYKELINNDLVISGLTASETFCVSLAEAQAAGIPVLSLDRGGQISFIKNNSGYLISNTHSAINTIQNHLNLDEMEILALGQNGIANTKKLSYSKIADRWFSFLEEINTGNGFNIVKYINDIKNSLLWKLKEVINNGV